jgi:hypothetical protein
MLWFYVVFTPKGGQEFLTTLGPPSVRTLLLCIMAAHDQALSSDPSLKQTYGRIFRMFSLRAGQHVKRTCAYMHVESYTHIT